MSPALHNTGITPEMMIMYYFDKNIFQGEEVEFFKQCYKEYLQKILEIQQMTTDDSTKSMEKIQLDIFAEEKGLANLEKVDWEGIAKRFDCKYVEEEQMFTNVKRGYLLFLDSKLDDIVEIKKTIMNKAEIISSVADRVNVFRQQQANLVKELFLLKEENRNLKSKISKLTKQLSEMEKVTQALKNENSIDKDKQIVELTKQNNFLLSRIENLENDISILQEDKKINETIQENIDIKEQIAEIPSQLPEYQDIVVLGGQWNSKEKEELQKVLQLCNIEFIDAEKTLVKIDRIANADIVIFDTSKNAHAYYFKAKQYAKKLLHVNKSKTEEVTKL
ncbi:MAG: hypothetical protein QXV17_13060 [Candidatus Micrarchaeaceae archaeon]